MGKIATKQMNFKTIFYTNLIVSSLIIVVLIVALVYNLTKPLDKVVKEDVSPKKNAIELIEKGYFDRCIAFYDSENKFDCGVSTLYDCQLICEEDIQKIKKMSENDNTRAVGIYLAQKDGEDIVFIDFLENDKYLSCKSVYHTSFNEILLEAQNISNSTFTDEYLNGSEYDMYDLNLRSGLEFIITNSSNGKYNLFLQFFVKDANNVERCYNFVK